MDRYNKLENLKAISYKLYNLLSSAEYEDYIDDVNNVELDEESIIDDILKDINRTIKVSQRNYVKDSIDVYYLYIKGLHFKNKSLYLNCIKYNDIFNNDTKLSICEADIMVEYLNITSTSIEQFGTNKLNERVMDVLKFKIYGN